MATMNVITISRQLGAGGAFVGLELAKKLQILFADKEIIQMAAEQLSTVEENLALREEKRLSFWHSFYKNLPLNDVISVPPVAPELEFSDEELFDVEAEVIKRIVATHSAVILGRCGFDVLKDHPNHVSVLLHADKDFRIHKMKGLYNLSDTEATKLIEKGDRERSIYCRTFTGKDWLNARNYDLAVDTSKISFEKAVEIILNYQQIKME